jgi:hypothetical protein
MDAVLASENINTVFIPSNPMPAMDTLYQVAIKRSELKRSHRFLYA